MFSTNLLPTCRSYFAPTGILVDTPLSKNSKVSYHSCLHRTVSRTVSCEAMKALYWASILGGGDGYRPHVQSSFILVSTNSLFIAYDSLKVKSKFLDIEKKKSLFYQCEFPCFAKVYRHEHKKSIGFRFLKFIWLSFCFESMKTGNINGTASIRFRGHRPATSSGLGGGISFVIFSQYRNIVILIHKTS